MAKVFIYNEYDLLDELNKCIVEMNKSLTYPDAFKIASKKITEIRDLLIQSTEVMIK